MALSDMLKPQVVELGAIKIGTLGEEITTRRGTKMRLPVRLDHFEVVQKYRDKDGRFIPDHDVTEKLREQCASEDGKVRRIPIAVLSDDIEDVLRASWVLYRGKRCEARSDGVTLWRYLDKQTGEMLEEPEQIPWKPSYAKAMKKHISLDVVIALPEAKWGGIYRFRTTSEISGDQLYGSLVHLKQLTGGILVGMPLMLVVRPIQVAPDGKVTTVFVVHVELQGADLMSLQTRALEMAKFQKDHRLQLATTRREMRRIMHDPGVDEDPETQEAIQAEFHPVEEDEPDTNGNIQRILDAKLAAFGCQSDKDKDSLCMESVELTYADVCENEPVMQDLLRRLQEWESQGKQFSTTNGEEE